MFAIRVWGLGFRVSGFRFARACLQFVFAVCVCSLCLQSGYRVLGFGFAHACLQFVFAICVCNSGLGFRVSGLHVRVC